MINYITGGPSGFFRRATHDGDVRIAISFREIPPVFPQLTQGKRAKMPSFCQLAQVLPKWQF
jgi:hypothetical protein